jgi:hypothetical protein
MGTATYEALKERARLASITSGYGAVVEIINYITGKSLTTVASGRTPIETHSRGCEFRGVGCQWERGKPYMEGERTRSQEGPPTQADRVWWAEQTRG